MKPLNRVLLLITAILASYQVVQGIDGLNNMAIACYTIAYGVIVIASLLMIILGLEVLDSPVVVIASSLIPLSLALGLISQFWQEILVPFGIFILAGFIAIFITRFVGSPKLAVVVLAISHGVAGLTIFFMPFILVIQGKVSAGFVFVGIGGMLIGLGGLLLSFLKAGKPLVPKERILAMFPGLLLLTTAAFVTGFVFI
jgi:hypothetical protein